MPQIIELPSEEEGEPQGCFSGIRKSFASRWNAFIKRFSGPRNSNNGTTFEINYDISNNCSQDYQHLKRKACKRVRTLGRDGYVIIGPYTGLEMFPEISICELPPQSTLHAAVEQMRQKGVNVLTGRWNVKGKPLMILFDIESANDDIIEHFRWNLRRDPELANFIESRFDTDRSEIVFEYRLAEFFTVFNRVNKHKAIAENIENPVTVSRLLTRLIKSV